MTSAKPTPTTDDGIGLLASFPYWIYVDTKSRLRPAEVEIEESVLRIYPPFRSAPANYVPMPLINLAEVPFPSGIKARLASPNPYAPTMAAVPQLARPDGQLLMTMCWTPEWKDRPRVFPMDSLRVDCFGPRAESHAHHTVREFLRWLRYYTRQWWIARSILCFTGDLRNAFGVARDGRPTKRLELRTGFRKLFGTEKGVTLAIWMRTMANLRRGRRVAVRHELLLDAQYYIMAEEYRRSILDAAIACELAKDLAYERLWIASGEQRRFKKGRVKQLVGSELPRHIANNLKAFAGRSLLDEHPETYGLIQRLWRARNDVAHGNEIKFLSGTTEEAERIGRMKLLVQAAERCVDWLDGLASEGDEPGA